MCCVLGSLIHLVLPFVQIPVQQKNDHRRDHPRPTQYVGQPILWRHLRSLYHPVPVASTGCADIVGFGLDGVAIIRNGFRVKTFTAVKEFGYNAGGWRVDKHIRLVADMTGDGTGDLVGFGDIGVLVSTNSGKNTFGPAKLVLKDFGYEVGDWRVDQHLRYLADIRGVGRCDIIGFGDRGVVVSKNNGNGKFGPAYVALNAFGRVAGGWSLDRHLRFLGDTTGDGLPDIIGFGEENIFISRNNGNGTFTPAQAVINNFCYGTGNWHIDRHPRFIADLTGDGKVDVVGFANAGVHVSLNQGNGVFGPPKLVVSDFGINQGWKVDQHPRFVADLTGDKRGDIIGFCGTGVLVAYNNGDGTFQPVKFVLDHFSVQQGWKVGEHPRFVVDLTGDGCADIIGFGGDGVYVAYNDGKGGFEPVQALTGEFTSNDGKWSAEKTVRWLANVSQVYNRFPHLSGPPVTL